MQLGGRRRGDKEPKPPRRMCDACMKFLNHEAETQEIPCERCGTIITWTKEHQLHVKLGAWVKPTLCADCRHSVATHKRASSEAEAAAPQAALEPNAAHVPSGTEESV